MSKKYEALLEIKIEKIESLHEYVSYCKCYFRPKSERKVIDYLYSKEKSLYKPISIDKNKIIDLINDFPIILAEKKYKTELDNNNLKGELFKFLKKFKSTETLKDFPLILLKEICPKNKNFEFSAGKQYIYVRDITGMFLETDKENFSHFINKLPPYSFILRTKFKLKQPYFSRDDDNFYIIQNPVLKDTAFKVPMVRGSTWKGALASSFKDLINESPNENDKITCLIESYLRIFGTGPESIEILEEFFRRKLEDKNSDLKKLKEKLLETLLIELGLCIDKETISEIEKANKDKIFNILREKLFCKAKKVLINSEFPAEFQTHKGRAIFYPTYFNKISLEVINPHNLRKRAGTQPIHYEVVPENTEGMLQIIYIPYDAILKPENLVKAEAEKDLNNLLSAVERLSQMGIGAKTKLGWGTFEICEVGYFAKDDLQISKELKQKGWSKC